MRLVRPVWRRESVSIAFTCNGIRIAFLRLNIDLWVIFSVLSNAARYRRSDLGKSRGKNMDAISRDNSPLHALLSFFGKAGSAGAARSPEQNNERKVAVGAANEKDFAQAGQDIAKTIASMELLEFVIHEKFSSEMLFNGTTENGATVAATLKETGLENLNVLLATGAFIHFEQISGNVRITDFDDGGIAVVTDGMTRNYDKDGNLISQSLEGDPLTGTGKADIILNANGTHIEGGEGNDTIYSLRTDVSINAGAGNDAVMVANDRYGGAALDVDLGDGDDSFSFAGGQEGGGRAASVNLQLKGGSGNDKIILDRRITNGNIDGEDGDDTIVTRELILNTQLYGGDGKDVISVNSALDCSIDGGIDKDNITIQSAMNTKFINAVHDNLNIGNNFYGDIHVMTTDENGFVIPSQEVNQQIVATKQSAAKTHPRSDTLALNEKKSNSIAYEKLAQMIRQGQKDFFESLLLSTVNFSER